MRAPSLYSYFSSKDAIYDAMFAQGYREFLDQERRPGADLGTELRRGAHQFVHFCVADPVRYQLLFQRTIPGFEPSAELAQQAYAVGMSGLIDFGIAASGLDMVTAVLTGLVDQQISNDPGGERWIGLADDAADMLCAYLTRGLQAAPDQQELEKLLAGFEPVAAAVCPDWAGLVDRPRVAAV